MSNLGAYIAEKAFEKGLGQGETTKLINLVCKKIQKNKSPEIIADELEEDLEVISAICSVADKVKPEYDSTKIYEMLHEDTKYGE